jgi:hypothetical protein
MIKNKKFLHFRVPHIEKPLEFSVIDHEKWRKSTVVEIPRVVLKVPRATTVRDDIKRYKLGATKAEKKRLKKDSENSKKSIMRCGAFL